MKTKVTLVTFVLGLALCALCASSAFAAAPYKYEKAFSERLSTTLKASVPSGFTRPWGLSFDAGSHLFVADPGQGAVEGAVDEFDQGNTFLPPQLGPGVLSGEFTRDAPVSDETGHLYVADSNSSELVVLGASGEKLSQWTGGNTPAGSFGAGCCFVYDAVDNSTSASRGDVYVMTNQAGGEVDVLRPQGEDKEEGEFLRKLEAPSGFSFGGENGDGLAVNDSSGPEGGEVYVVDTGNKVLDRFSASGGFEAAHQIKGPSGSEPFQEPVAVAVDEETGDAFVADRGAQAIDQFSPDGEFLAKITETEAGEGFEPLGVAVQRAGAHRGEVYVSDRTKGLVDVFALEVPERPTVTGALVTQVSGDSANLAAQINPHGETTGYRFEYGACAAQGCPLSPYQHSVPSPEGSVGEEGDFGARAVLQHIQGLSPSSTYHFRVVAHNAHGEAAGEERSFSTQGAGGELLLPDARAWELVSPPDKHGGSLQGIGEVGVVEAAASGDAISYLANAPTEASPPGNATEVQVLSRREGGGWGSRDIAVPHTRATGEPIGEGREYRFFAEDLESAVVQPFGLFEAALSEEASEQTPYLHALGGCEGSCYRPLVSAKPGHENVPVGTRFGEELVCEEENGVLSGRAAAVCGPRFIDATPDLAHIVLFSEAPLMSGAPREELYEHSGGSLQLVSVLAANEAGEELPAPAGSAHLGANFGSGGGRATQAISADGTRVFWEAEGALYMRDTQTQRTLQVDAAEAQCVSEGECESGEARFQLASADGSRVLFTDTHKLSKDSGAGSGKRDLYECRVTIGEGGEPSCAPNGPIDLTPQAGGESASVQGDLAGASKDAQTLYFVAEGTLGTGANARGQSALGGQPNLYVRRGAQTSFIATLASGDDFDWVEGTHSTPTRASESGQWLSFLSERSLTGYDNHDANSGHPDAEIYIYDATTGGLSCASCNPTGARPSGVEYGKLREGDERLLAGEATWEPAQWVAAVAPIPVAYALNSAAYEPRYLSDSGRLFFNSLDALVPQDVNGNADVYQYEPAGFGSCSSASASFSERSGGCTELISSGSSAQQSAFLDASESGADVFFLTTAKLSPADLDANYDIYDAHICSSASPCIPQPPVPPPPCSTEASCKASPTSQPSIFGAPASATFEGPGNPPPPSPPAPVVKPVAKKTSAQIKAEKLSKALKSCKKDKNKKKRSTCEKSAHKRFGRGK